MELSRRDALKVGAFGAAAAAGVVGVGNAWAADPRHVGGHPGEHTTLNRTLLLGQPGAGGYRPIDNALAVMHVGGPGVASTAGVDCASVRKTLRVLADGDPDPKTGACTSVSTGLNFAAKPAFVFDKGVLVGAPRGAPVQQAQR